MFQNKPVESIRCKHCKSLCIVEVCSKCQKKIRQATLDKELDDAIELWRASLKIKRDKFVKSYKSSNEQIVFYDYEELK